jgi:hypothetical protein
MRDEAEPCLVPKLPGSQAPAWEMFKEALASQSFGTVSRKLELPKWHYQAGAWERVNPSTLHPPPSTLHPSPLILFPTHSHFEPEVPERCLALMDRFRRSHKAPEGS